MRKHPRILVLPTQLQIFIKISKTGKGIGSNFVYHEIQRHLLNQIIYQWYEKYLQEKISYSEFRLLMCFEHPAEYFSTFVPLNFVISPVFGPATSSESVMSYII